MTESTSDISLIFYPLFYLFLMLKLWVEDKNGKIKRLRIFFFFFAYNFSRFQYAPATYPVIYYLDVFFSSFQNNFTYTSVFLHCLLLCIHACSLVQPCLTLCDPMDCSQQVSSTHRILQARILGWVAISYSRGSSQPRDHTSIF